MLLHVLLLLPETVLLITPADIPYVAVVAQCVAQ